MKDLLKCALALMAILCLNFNVNSQTAGTLDTSFDPVTPLSTSAGSYVNSRSVAIGKGEGTDKIFSGHTPNTVNVPSLIRCQMDGSQTQADVDYCETFRQAARNDNASGLAVWEIAPQIDTITGLPTDRVYIGVTRNFSGTTFRSVNLINGNGSRDASFNIDIAALGVNAVRHCGSALLHDYEKNRLIYAARVIHGTQKQIWLVAADPYTGVTLAVTHWQDPDQTCQFEPDNAGIFSIKRVPGTESSYLIVGNFSMSFDSTNRYNGIMQMELDGNSWVPHPVHFANTTNSAHCNIFNDALLIENIGGANPDIDDLCLIVAGQFPDYVDETNTNHTGLNSMLRYDYNDSTDTWTFNTSFKGGVGQASGRQIFDLCSYNCTIIGAGLFNAVFGTNAPTTASPLVYSGLATWDYNGNVTGHIPQPAIANSGLRDTSPHNPGAIADIEIQGDNIVDGNNNWEIVAVGNFDVYGPPSGPTIGRDRIARLHGINVTPANAHFSLFADSNDNEITATGQEDGTWEVYESVYDLGALAWSEVPVVSSNPLEIEGAAGNLYRVVHTVTTGCGSSCQTIEGMIGFMGPQSCDPTSQSGSVELRSAKAPDSPVLNTLQNGNDFLVYPNPSNSTFIIKGNFDDKQQVTLTVTDLMGKQVLSKQINSFNPSGEELDMKAYSNGTYLLTLMQGSKRLTQTIIKE